MSDQPEPRSDDERRRHGGRSAEADGWGVVGAYEDAFGDWTEVPAATRDALVEAMGGDPSADGPPSDARGDDVHVVRRGERLPVDGPVEARLEDGSTTRLSGTVPDDLPFGHHDLLVAGADRANRLIVSPGSCHLPANLRTWGWAAQLYATRSRDSWGVGDLADLRRLGSWASSLGAGTLLVNPLNAVNPTTPRETSPYFPTSRRWRDPLYLRIEEVPGAAEVGAVDELAVRGRALGDDRTIDRDAVTALKTTALELVWAGRRGDESGLAAYRDEHGASLDRFATFLALAEHHGSGWRDWPDEHRHPDAPAVARFAEDHADRVAFHGWVQWLLDEQLRRAGEAVPLLADLPIGADPDGADAWAWQDLLAEGVTVGAPPDQLGPQGQDWSLPAFVPWKLRQARFEPLVDVLRAGFRHAGGLRIDHVLGLFRMFWIPPGGTAADGTYVRQPSRELLDVLALESHRAGAFVVGEDLGTVEEGVRPELAARSVLRYQVWWFEEDPIDTWTEDALASVSTHDLPTVAGVWSGEDARMQRDLGLEPDTDWHAELRDRLVEQTALTSDAAVDDVTVAVHRELATAPNRVVVAQLEDALVEPARTNVPGTDRDVRPNWSLALPVTLEELTEHPTALAVADAMQQARPDEPTPDP